MHDFIHVVRRDTKFFERCQEMLKELIEVRVRDTPTMVNPSQVESAVLLRTSERRPHEFALHASKFVHRRVMKKRR